MQYFVREELNLDAPINLKRLSPAMKLYAGFMCKWRETKMYKNSYNKRKEAEHAARVQKDEKLKESLLVIIYKELDNNESMQKHGEECVELVLCIKSNFIHSLDRILTHSEFLPYEITKVPETRDFRVAFPEMPVILRVCKKSLTA